VKKYVGSVILDSRNVFICQKKRTFSRFMILYDVTGNGGSAANHL